MKRKWLAWTLVIVWMAVIFCLSHQPSSSSSALSSGVTAAIVNTVHQWLPDAAITVEGLHFWIRKAAHFSAYFLLGVLTLQAWKKSGISGERAIIYAWLLCVLYAMSDEFHQLFVSGRSGEVRDVAIDSTGAFTGIVLCWIISWIHRRLNRKKWKA
ncbi:VanZ family protein [Virgibacillus halophilus]|uniref:VanZ family protein n=1 Tax=Tigheibacillus halophilus TaxID=361280 RepID=A0ABU5C4A6_9BACI|nr:VanZ family protein [Virgibacillus halophilus]